MTNREFIETFVTLCEGYGIGPFKIMEHEYWVNASLYVPNIDLWIWEDKTSVLELFEGKQVTSYILDSPQAYADKVREIINA